MLIGEMIPTQSSISFFQTIKGSQIGINGRCDSGDNRDLATATYAYNGYNTTVIRFISETYDLEVTDLFISSSGGGRIELTSPTIYVRIDNPTDAELKIRHLYITEYY